MMKMMKMMKTMKTMKTIRITLALLILTVNLLAQNPAIYLEKNGAGESMLFLSGFSAPAAVWDETIANLMGEFTMHKVSYAGFNGLPSIEMPWYETIKKELLQYIESQKMESIVIIGHSMGGMLALDLASEIPDKISKLIIVDALTCMRELMMPGVPNDAIQYETTYNNQMLKQNDSARKAMAYMMSANMTIKPDKVDLLAKWSMAADMKTFVYGYTDLLKLDLRPALNKIKAKVLIIAAPFPNRELVNKSLADQYANLGQKNIVIAPNSRHYIMFDQPQWFYEKVNIFLAN
jgi:pimeloyl-ACP methyl ester carboxylesterase